MMNETVQYSAGLTELTLCRQPDCLMQAKGFNDNAIAEMLIGILEGRQTSPAKRIVARNYCTACVLRIMRGSRPYRTAQQHEKLVRQGEWHQRRSRRHKAH